MRRTAQDGRGGREFPFPQVERYSARLRKDGVANPGVNFRHNTRVRSAERTARQTGFASDRRN
jgi:hypothetical protein